MSDQSKNLQIPNLLQFFSVAEVALIIGVSKKLVHKWINEGLLPAFRVGANSRLLRVRQQDLEEFIDEHTQYHPPKFNPD